MKKKRQHIQRVLTLLLLGVFALAITPWSAIHHHDRVIVSNDKNCSHKLHVKTQQETCLICAAHFEKNYTVQKVSYEVYFLSKPISSIHPSIGASFTALISTSLRGPPSLT